MTAGKNYTVEDNLVKCVKCHTYFVDLIEGDGGLCDKCTSAGDEIDEINSSWVDGELAL